MRASQDDRDDYKRQREIDDQVHAATKALIDGYLAIPAAGLARAVVDSEGFKAIAELRRVNKVLRENGFQYPLGAQGVEDLITHMGALQLREDEVALLVNLVGYADDGVHFQQQEYQDLISRIRDVATEK